MANTSIDLVSLDFFTLKNSLKQYLQNNNQFKDYDFEGSNINLLLDLLSYNTHKNAFYYNMVISEAFLDSAQTRAAIISHAKDLNYLPKSRRSAKARVRINFEATSASAPYLIPRGSPLTTLIKNQTFTFTVPENLLVSSGTNSYSFETDLYEGIYLRDAYTVSSEQAGQRYRITNSNVDTNSIIVSVYEDQSEVPIDFKVSDTLLGVDNDSTVFFVQAVGNGYYEILFGDNIFGRRPKIGSTVVIEYRVTEGDAANGAKAFSVDFDPTGKDELTDTPIAEVLEISADGSLEQSIESIRQYAPRYFATQQRAVSADDYASLILAKFNGTIDDVVVYGGETLPQKLYGRVVVAVKPVTGTIVPTFIKDEISNYLLDFVSLPTRVILTDPEYFNVQVKTTVQYDLQSTNKTPNEIRSIVLNAIEQYSRTNLEKFNADFRYSRFVNTIDDSDPAITSNDTNIRIIKKLQPTVSEFNSYIIEFNNRLHPPRGVLVNPVVESTGFTYVTAAGVEYPDSYIQDDGDGTLIVFTYISDQMVTLNSNIGTVDHATGKITINKLLLSGFAGTSLSIYATVLAKDLIINKQNVLAIDQEDITISVIGKLD